MFTTASGKPSHVSAAGLRKAAKLFNGPDVPGYAGNEKISLGKAVPRGDKGDAVSAISTKRNESSTMPEATFPANCSEKCKKSLMAESWPAYSSITSESDALHTLFESRRGTTVAVHPAFSRPTAKSESDLTGLHHTAVAVKTSTTDCAISKDNRPLSTLLMASIEIRAKNKRRKRREDDDEEEVTSKNTDRDTSTSLQHKMPCKRQKRKFSTPMQKLEPSLHPTSAAHGPSLPIKPYVHICTQQGSSAKRAKLHLLYKETWQQPRKSIKEHFESWGCQNDMHAYRSDYPSKQVLEMTPDSAVFFKFSESPDHVGPVEMRMKLLEAGANPKEATSRWVENHYRWIVWKLASHERLGGLKLTVDRVLDELKYRYEREVNCSSRSALKRITEKDAVSRQEMIVCVSAVPDGDTREEKALGHDRQGVQPRGDVNGQKGPQSGSQSLAKIEVTDGWYCLPAYLDKNLSRLMRSGQLFVGQKIKVCGASMQGCEEAMPPLDAVRVMSLKLDQNGTRRAGRFDQLGFCRGPPQPLFLGCVSSTGGQVPLTAVAILRTYPILYREKVGNGGVTRSARAEDVASRRYEERRVKMAEEVAHKFEGVDCSSTKRKHGEGGRLAIALESSTDPEGFFAGLTQEQQRSLLLHREWEQESRRGAVESATKEAVEAEGLGPRDVCPLLRIRVASLLSPAMKRKIEEGGQRQVEGVITIWRPSEEQIEEVEKGGMFLVSSLQPTHHSTPTLLSFNTTRSTRWRRISEQAGRHLSCCTQPRKATLIADLHLLPLQSEFDVVGWVVRVGMPLKSGFRASQWIFLAEDSNGMGFLAVEFSAFAEAFVPMEEALTSTVIGWSGLLHKARDERNGIEIGEATDAAQLYTSFGSKSVKHMGDAVAHTKQWIDNAYEVRDMLRLQVDDIIKRNP